MGRAEHRHTEAGRLQSRIKEIVSVVTHGSRANGRQAISILESMMWTHVPMYNYACPDYISSPYSLASLTKVSFLIGNVFNINTAKIP